MFRYLQCLVIALLFLLPTLTQAGDIYDDLSQDDLWEIIEAKDYAAAEEMFAQSHRLSLRDAEAVDHTRWLFGVFGTNNPKVAHFAEEWLEAYPQSAYAHTGQVWVLHRTAWYIRGEGLARTLYYDAMATFGAMHREAWQLAERAYELAPDLLPASDAIIRLANSTRNQDKALAVLDTVMREAPNYGTLNRAIDLTNPGWGGSWELVEYMCSQYAPLVEIHGSDDNVLWCKLFAAGTYHLPSRRDWFMDEAAKRQFRNLEDLYARNIWTRTATQEEAAFLNEYLSDPNVTNANLAYNFDSDLARKYGYEFVYESHIRRAKEHANAQIERDPYNPRLLEILLKDISGFSITEDDRLRMSVIERTPREDKVEYSRRLLQSSPYDPELWKQFAQYKFNANNARHALLDEPYLTNSIVYENHNSSALQGFATSRWMLLSQLERLEWETEQPRWKEQSPEQLEQNTAILESWIARRETLDLDAQIRCPMMRAYRLYKMLCGRPGQGACQIQPQMKDMLQLVRDDVNKRRVCTGVMAASEYDLYFQPINVDLYAPVPD
ncbi:hypothetical protein [Roseovarius rhodophyticola]|uniref:DUF4034 domain-containing protein n=1 Tax=Roseovarius rhodophyticola TaxID=3080827 RepID=A0ABZ2TGX4_9RHOB|nr:hypothetical protein [Roseovarius sp. W115]